MTNLIKLSDFQLQTKIRYLIKELLEVTSNKVAEFNCKIDIYDKFFQGFSSRINSIQSQAKNQMNETLSLKDKSTQLEKSFEKIIIESTEQNNKIKFMVADLKQLFNNVQSDHEKIQLIDKKINNQSAKNKNKFNEINKLIVDLKSEISDKITKSIQEGVETNAQIKSLYNKMANDLFRTDLSIETQRKHYYQILEKIEIQNDINKDIELKLKQMQINLSKKLSDSTLKQILTMTKQDVYCFVKQNNLKFESKIQKNLAQRIKNSEQIINLNNKIDGCKKQLNEIDNNMKKIKLYLEQKIIQIEKQNKDIFSKQLFQAKNQINKIQKQLKQYNKKFNDIRFQNASIKKQIEKSIYQTQFQKKTKIPVERVGNSTRPQLSSTDSNQFTQKIQQILERIQNIQSTIQNSNKENQRFQDRIINIVTNLEQNQQKRMNQIMNKNNSNMMLQIQHIQKQTQKMIEAQRKDFEKLVQKIQQLQKLESKIIKIAEDIITQKNHQFECKIYQTFQKITLNMNKIRGEITNKTEFCNKQIRQTIKKLTTESQKIRGILKILPAISQSINLVISLFYDLEFEAARIIHDKLPKPLTEKIMTMTDGILYEYKDNRKNGTINYRHREIKKILLIKAIFVSLIETWEQLLQNEFKQKLEYFPKGFYKNIVQKNITFINLPQEKQNSFLQIHKSISMHIVKNMKQSPEGNDEDKKSNNNNNNVNKSFQIKQKYKPDNKPKSKVDYLSLYSSFQKNSKSFIDKI